MKPRDIDFLVHHIILPSKVPGQIEEDRHEREAFLLRLLRSAIVGFKQGVGRSQAATLTQVEKALVWWEEIRGPDHKLSSECLIKVLDSLQDGGNRFSFPS
jgi:hypothetical protein